MKINEEIKLQMRTKIQTPTRKTRRNYSNESKNYVDARNKQC